MDWSRNKCFDCWLFGAKRQDKANSVVTMGLILSLSVGIIVNIIVLLVMTPYYSAFTEDNQIFEYGCIYMQICAFMQVPNMVHIAIQKCCKQQAI